MGCSLGGGGAEGEEHAVASAAPARLITCVIIPAFLSYQMNGTLLTWWSGRSLVTCAGER